jgi:lysophospholipase L1-like esterase
MSKKEIPAARLRGRLSALVAVLLLLGIGAGIFATLGDTGAVEAAAGPRIYVASGDDIPAGHDLNDNAKRYPEKLLADHLKSPGWAVYNQAKNGQTSSAYITGGGLSSAYNMRPDLLTIQLGEQNATIVNLVKSCFDKVKDHDFTGANVCAAAILGNASLWTNLQNNYTTILQQTRIMASQRPGLVIAVMNYPNPYPSATSATTSVPLLCVPLIDTAITCTTRWAQFPPALVTIDQVFQKMNSTLKSAMAPFQAGPNGSRWVYVDVYSKFSDHCMKMDVSIKTTVNHGTYTDQHDSQRDFGCSSPWFIEGSTGMKIPDYLDPAATGVLVMKTQTTTGMGVWVNADGQKCISDAIWEADTIDPGVTPLKWKLGYGEAANSNICQ